MHEYDYKKAKIAIEEILASPTSIIEKESIPSNEYEYSNTKGIKTWAACVFVDIADSHHLFDGANEDTIRLMRAYCSELIKLFKEDRNSREVGIRDDCVYCIYNLGKKEDLQEIFNTACTINTFMKMFNKILVNKGLEPITAGIGLGCDYEMIIKVGEPNSHINDKVWIGNAIGHASYLSNIANRNGHSPIAMSSLFYDNVIPVLEQVTPKYREWLKPIEENGKVEYYECNFVMQQFNEWIEKNL